MLGLVREEKNSGVAKSLSENVGQFGSLVKNIVQLKLFKMPRNAYRVVLLVNGNSQCK